MTDLRKLQKELKAKKPLKLKDFKISPEEAADVSVFVLNLLEKYTTNCKSYNFLGNQEDYGSKRRSFGDIYRLCLNYFPELTVEGLFKVLYWLYIAGFIKTFYCCTIDKRVWFKPEYMLSSGYDYYDDKDKDEHGITWKDIENIANL